MIWEKGAIIAVASKIKTTCFSFFATFWGGRGEEYGGVEWGGLVSRMAATSKEKKAHEYAPTRASAAQYAHGSVDGARYSIFCEYGASLRLWWVPTPVLLQLYIILMWLAEYIAKVDRNIWIRVLLCLALVMWIVLYASAPAIPTVSETTCIILSCSL